MQMSILSWGLNGVAYAWMVPQGEGNPVYGANYEYGIEPHRAWYDMSPEIRVSGPLAQAVHNAR